MSESISAAEPDFAAFIAIDWADREHAFALQVDGGKKREKGKFLQKPNAIEEWASQLAARFPGQRVAVALEQARGALFYALSRYDHLVLYPVHPSTSYDYRKAVFPSGSKSDPQDADLLLDLLTLHRDRLRRFEPDDEATRKLQLLVEKRRQVVDMRTAHTNRITNQLKLYFPQILDWFDDLSAPIVQAFLRRWPTLAELQKETADTLRCFFHEYGSRSSRRIEQRLEDIRQTKAPLEDLAIIDPGVMLVHALLDVVAALRDSVHRFDTAIAELAQSHPDYAIFASFPGAGPAMTPRLLAAFGSRRDRYSSASQMQTFSGIAPVQEASGNHQWIHFRFGCPKFLRQTFHEFTALSLQQCRWAKEFYSRQKEKGKSHHAAVRSLAFKWIRILFRCWQSRQPYHDALYEAARTARAIPLSRAPLPLPRHPENSKSTRAKHPNCEMKKLGDLLKSFLAQP